VTTIQMSLTGDHKVELQLTDLLREYRNAYPHIHDFYELLEKMIAGKFKLWGMLSEDEKLKLSAFIKKIPDLQRINRDLESKARSDSI